MKASRDQEISAPPAARPALRQLRRYVPTTRNASSLYLLVAIFVLFSIWIPNSFLTTTTFKVTGSQQAVTVLVALAILIPFSAGVFDLSAGYMVDFSLVVLSWLRLHTHMNVWLACILVLMLCALVGIISGIITVRFKVNSFIATLGVGQVLSAFTLLLSKNEQIIGVLPQSFQDAGSGDWLGIPRVVFVVIVVAAVAWYVLEWTPLGRSVRTVGANPEAARLVGLPVGALVTGSLAVSAAIAGLGGIVLGSQLGLFSAGQGPPLLFPAFAALFLGSTQFKPRPNVWGTVVAGYVLAFGIQGFQLASAGGGYWVTPMFAGGAMLLAVIFAGRVRRQGPRFAQWRRSRRNLPPPPTDPADPAAAEPATVGDGPARGGQPAERGSYLPGSQA